ncbi:hypothetical protein BpHYR1_010795 [Brachionus plicatilis]|uniref:Uncharacterized protein n=1 Tax=Brachionus plicatilis TaxID=10195 RepID=A0A3M7QVJ3_BRAPC|nr:hypothetical protein BpHYR1_010795 [Brachionus plicatilis]
MKQLGFIIDEMLLNINTDDFNEINDLLDKFGHFSFQHRLLERMLTFSCNIINFSNCSRLLKEEFKRNNTNFTNYQLRNMDNFIETGAGTKIDEKTFGYIFTRLANKFVI